jgi:hypothetical protein
VASGGLPAELVADLKKALDGALAQSAADPFGFGFPWATRDTTSHGAGLAVMASEYDQLTGTGAYAGESARWLGNILGANAWGSSFIIGDGSTFPHCPHHQVANLVGSLDGTLRGVRRSGQPTEPLKSGVTFRCTHAASGVTRRRWSANVTTRRWLTSLEPSTLSSTKVPCWDQRSSTLAGSWAWWPMAQVRRRGSACGW